MNDYEKRKIENCLYTIWENYTAMKNEMNTNESPYKGYLLKKARPILNDIQVIISLCEKEELQCQKQF